jgi:poly-gamma-glutamate capsule biosynthesis protein CapA/YwtB (metallophosphatase superfamily)
MEPRGPSCNPVNCVLWQSPSSAEIAARVAITGDFAPAPNYTIYSEKDWREKARPLFPLFRDIDTTFVNLECTLTTGDMFSAVSHGTRRAAPVSSLDYLAAIHASTIGLANHHSYEYGAQVVDRARKTILKRGMIPVGAGGKLGSHPEVRLWHGPDQIRVGFWAAANISGESTKYRPRRIESANLDRGLYALECMRRHEARFCVALLHTGSPRSSRPAPADVRLMDSLARWGFDVVAASHSHRISGAKIIEGYREREAFCFYGLGNLVSGRLQSSVEAEGLVAVAGFNANGDLACIELTPLVMDRQGFGKIPSQEGIELALRRFRTLSDEITDGSYERLHYRDIAEGLVKHCIRDVRLAYQASGIAAVTRKAKLMRARQSSRFMGKLAG